MKKSFYFLCTLALTGTLFSCNPTENEPAETDYTKYVNTFIGAADNGHTFPGACRPFGMIQTSPVTGAVVYISVANRRVLREIWKCLRQQDIKLSELQR